MILVHTTEAERAAIKQAMMIIDDGGYEGTFKRKKWKGPYKGVYKRAFIKNGIVVKFGPMAQLKGEIKLWNKKTHRRYLTRSFGIYTGWLFQRYVKSNAKNRGRCTYRCDDAADRMNIGDAGPHNHRHLADGTPVWFDTNTF